MSAGLADAIDALLPQTQCTRCGYAACRPYAEAVACGDAEANRCPPGGAAGARALSALLGREAIPLDESRGAGKPLHLAFVDEARCIGCTLCIAACPVDAIAGAAKQMHAVIAAFCTGCELCVVPCPVDCISMVPAPQPWSAEQAARARQRFRSRSERLARERDEEERRFAALAGAGP